ncbi:hypothetical protein A3F06_02340 [candidate division TM6 bacterium RIFCSPHIGHO2_12_FULL_36_22]|nr:MAG: hypothetical protein A3F06_02340 [candidate division TM6 bacterium RIFCSPHIGHO2_12_FULL_36_22]
MKKHLLFFLSYACLFSSMYSMDNPRGPKGSSSWVGPVVKYGAAAVALVGGGALVDQRGYDRGYRDGQRATELVEEERLRIEREGTALLAMQDEHKARQEMLLGLLEGAVDEQAGLNITQLQENCTTLLDQTAPLLAALNVADSANTIAALTETVKRQNEAFANMRLLLMNPTGRKFVYNGIGGDKSVPHPRLLDMLKQNKAKNIIVEMEKALKNSDEWAAIVKENKDFAAGLSDRTKK